VLVGDTGEGGGHGIGSPETVFGRQAIERGDLVGRLRTPEVEFSTETAPTKESLSISFTD